VWCAGLRERTAFSSPAAAIAVAALVSQTAMGLALGAAVAGVRYVAGAPAVHAADVEACYRSSSAGALGALPPGLVVADIDLGPFVVATTGHRVVAAPYHRLDKGILAAHAILEGPSGQALARLEALGVDYLALCAVPGQSSTPGSLRGRLLAGEGVDFLEALDIPAAHPIRAWRVAPRRS
jgi:hypothetical protein